jgi:hypothetical protein
VCFVSAQLMRFHCRIPLPYISVVPIWLCRLRRSAFVFLRTLLCLLCSALAVLCARADGFCGSACSGDRCDSFAADCRCRRFRSLAFSPAVSPSPNAQGRLDSFSCTREVSAMALHPCLALAASQRRVLTRTKPGTANAPPRGTKYNGGVSRLFWPVEVWSGPQWPW